MIATSAKSLPRRLKYCHVNTTLITLYLFIYEEFSVNFMWNNFVYICKKVVRKCIIKVLYTAGNWQPVPSTSKADLCKRVETRSLWYKQFYSKFYGKWFCLCARNPCDDELKRCVRRNLTYVSNQIRWSHLVSVLTPILCKRTEILDFPLQTNF